MNLQYITDSLGNTAGVFIPIDDWEKVKSEVTEGDYGPSKEEILKGIAQAVHEMNMIKNGKLTARPIEEFLDEL